MANVPRNQPKTVMSGYPDRHRAVVSHVQATSEQLATEVRGCNSMLAVYIFDETGVWVRRPRQMRAGGDSSDSSDCEEPNEVQKEIEKKMQSVGRNVHLPVFNCVEKIFVRRPRWSPIDAP